MPDLNIGIDLRVKCNCGADLSRSAYISWDDKERVRVLYVPICYTCVERAMALRAKAQGAK